METIKKESMTKEEYIQLESLLGKLQIDLGHRVCILTGHIHDGYHIGIYSSNSGTKRKEASGPTIEDVVNQLKETIKK
jgi:hypothetical protein